MLDISYNQMRFQSTKEEFKQDCEAIVIEDGFGFQSTKEEFKQAFTKYFYNLFRWFQSTKEEFKRGM